MELIVWGFIAIVAIGAIVAGIFGLAVVWAFWWIAIPIIGALIGGWIGFFFGLGLVVIIGIIVAAFKQ